MARSEQLIELIKSHIDGDDSRFYSIALQVAAHAANQGHKNLAKELKDIVIEARTKTSPLIRKRDATKSFIEAKGELADLLIAEYPEISLKQLSLNSEIKKRLELILEENKSYLKLQEFSLEPRRKILLFGPPGTGKTMTASALATELRLPLFTIKFDSLITKFLGETSSKLRLVFNAIESYRGVYLFDEFDALGSKRSNSNDVGEVRRILNTFLQFIDKDKSDSLIVAATNHLELLDLALFRRFDDVIKYSLPEKSQIKEIIINSLIDFQMKDFKWTEIYNEAKGLSQAEISAACYNAAKKSVLKGYTEITNAEFVKSLLERKNFNV